MFLFVIKNIFLFCVYDCLVCTHVCAPHTGSADRGQNKILDPVELELQLACELSKCWEFQYPLEEPPVLITTEPSLWPLKLYFLMEHKVGFFEVHSVCFSFHTETLSIPTLQNAHVLGCVPPSLQMFLSILEELLAKTF